MKFITCDEWGAEPAKGVFDAEPAAGIVIHNTEEDELDTPEATARGIQRAHFARRFKDSGQHFTISKDGTVLEGRHGSSIAASKGLVVQSAHAGSTVHNNSWYGIELCGDNQIEYVVTDAQREALVELCALLSICRGKILPIIGHMEVHETTCPGRIMEHLDALRYDVAVRCNGWISDDQS